MKWLELSVRTPPEFVEPLSQIFLRYGYGGVAVEEEGGFNPDEGESRPATAWVIVKTYLPLDETAQGRRDQIDLGVRLVAHVADISALEVREVDEEEWQSAWKEYFQVLHVGQRTVIAPTWREHVPRPSEILIRLDPGMAFGTGHHPTTRMCLEQLEALVMPGMEVLDVGCGSGILSIAAARLGAKGVLGLEIDSVAVRVARENSKANQVGGVVHVYEGTLPSPHVRPHSFDLALANISARVVSELARELTRAVRPGGHVLVSGVLVENEARVALALEAAGATLEKTVTDGDWVAMVARA